MDSDFEEKRNVAGCCAFCIVLLTGIILFAVSFATLDPLHAGVKYNNNLKSIEMDRVYNNGRYFVGLGLSFKEYPTSLQVIELRGDSGEDSRLRAWSIEGQLVEIDLSFYYKLQRDQLVNFYLRYGQDWKSQITRIAIRSIKQISIKYSTEEFFLKRQIIGDDMRETLRTRLAQEFVDLEVFSLRGINIPDDFEAKIVDKVVTTQNVKTEINLAATAQLRAQIEVIKGQGDADVGLTLALARAESIKTVETAKSDGRKALRQQEAASYNLLNAALGFNSSDLVQYRFAQLTDTLSKRTTPVNFVVGFDSAGVKINA